jgi:hypothetical protein
MTSKWSKAFWYDLGERVASTFLGALLAYIVTDNALERVGFDQLWPVIILPTLVSLIKGLLANMASPASGASLVPSPPGPVEVDNTSARKTDLGAADGILIGGIMLLVLGLLLWWLTVGVLSTIGIVLLVVGIVLIVVALLRTHTTSRL